MNLLDQPKERAESSSKFSLFTKDDFVNHSPKPDYEYTPDGIKADVENKCKIIREWAKENGFVEGEDFVVIASITDVESSKTIAPHELKSFAVIFHENIYDKFKDFVLSKEYRSKREKHLGAKSSPKLDYSWAGRFLVGWDGVPFDTASVLSFGNKKGEKFNVRQLQNVRAATHHGLFKDFFRERVGHEFPDINALNALLARIARDGLGEYKGALAKLNDMRNKETIPTDGYGLINSLIHKVMILENALSGDALDELDDVIVGPMPPKMRHYADLTYNVDDMKGELDRVTEITGVQFSDRIRVDKLFDEVFHEKFDPRRMEELCADFREWLKVSGDLE